jgi:hypothetical protein
MLHVSVAADLVWGRTEADLGPEFGCLLPAIADVCIHRGVRLWRADNPSEEFRRYWSANKVHQRTTGTKDYHHPLVGDLTVTYQP